MKKQTSMNGITQLTMTRRHAIMAGISSVAALSAMGWATHSMAADKKVDRIGFDHPYNNIPIFSTIMKHAGAEAKDASVELLIAVDDARIDKQLANVQGWIAQGVPAMTVFPLEVTSMEPIAKSAIDAGLVWVTYAGEMKNQSGCILLNNKESGMQLGQAAAKWAKDGGIKPKVVLLEYRESGTIGIERCDGMKQGLLEAVPDAEIVATQTANTPETALTAMSTILNTNPDVNMVLCYNDDGATGAYRAFMNAGHESNDPKIFIGGQDGAKETLELVKKGTMLRATSALSIAALSRACVSHPLAIAQGTAKETTLQMPIECLTAADQDKLDKYLSDLA